MAGETNCRKMFLWASCINNVNLMLSLTLAANIEHVVDLFETVTQQKCHCYKEVQLIAYLIKINPISDSLNSTYVQMHSFNLHH